MPVSIEESHSTRALDLAQADTIDLAGAMLPANPPGMAEHSLSLGERPTPEIVAYHQCVRAIAERILELVGQGRNDVIDFTRFPPDPRELRVEPNGGVALQMDRDVPFRILTPLGALSIMGGFPTSQANGKLESELGLRCLLPKSVVPFGTFGPIYSITRDPSGGELPEARLVQSPASAQQSLDLALTWQKLYAELYPA